MYDKEELMQAHLPEMEQGKRHAAAAAQARHLQCAVNRADTRHIL